MVPMKVATGSSVKIVRAYRVNIGSGNNGPPAVKVVLPGVRRRRAPVLGHRR